VSFTYDASGNLATATDANGHATGYTYDSSHRLVSERQPKAMADPAIDPLFTNTWLNGRVSSQTDALGWNAPGSAEALSLVCHDCSGDLLIVALEHL
jgi:YD repeat-containing protein